MSWARFRGILYNQFTFLFLGDKKEGREGKESNDGKKKGGGTTSLLSTSNSAS